MTNFPTSLRLTALAATLACLAGCGSLPSAPVLDDSAARVATNGVQAQQAFTLPSDDGPLPEGPAPTNEPTPPDDELAPIGAGGSSQNQGTLLSETNGGIVRSGRWRIVVPPGAISGSARFTVTPSTTSGGIVRLGILPLEKNQFAKPVLLVADCHNVPPKQLRSWFVSWFNPRTGSWERVPGSTVDTKKKTVSASLSHFSTYMVGPDVGRAGW